MKEGDLVRFYDSKRSKGTGIITAHIPPNAFEVLWDTGLMTKLLRWHLAKVEMDGSR